MQAILPEAYIENDEEHVSANDTVTMMWLVTVKANGISPIMFKARMNMNSVNTNGKNCMPSVPAVLRIVLATNS